MYYVLCLVWPLELIQPIPLPIPIPNPIHNPTPNHNHKAELKTGKRKGISSDGAGVGYGVQQKWSRPHDNHKDEREAMVRVLREIVQENRLVNVMSKPLKGDRVSTVLLNGKPDEKRWNYLSGWLA